MHLNRLVVVNLYLLFWSFCCTTDFFAKFQSVTQSLYLATPILQIRLYLEFPNCHGKIGRSTSRDDQKNVFHPLRLSFTGQHEGSLKTEENMMLDSWAP